jgi:hypothetical protein
MSAGEEMGKCTGGALPIAQAGGGVGQIPARSGVGTVHTCEDGVNGRKSCVRSKSVYIHELGFSSDCVAKSRLTVMVARRISFVRGERNFSTCCFPIAPPKSLPLSHPGNSFIATRRRHAQHSQQFTKEPPSERLAPPSAPLSLPYRVKGRLAAGILSPRPAPKASGGQDGGSPRRGKTS